MVRPARLERATFWFVVRRSVVRLIPLSIVMFKIEFPVMPPYPHVSTDFRPVGCQTGCQTMEIPLADRVEMFKVYDGQIHAVEAFMEQMPRGAGSRWD